MHIHRLITTQDFILDADGRMRQIATRTETKVIVQEPEKPHRLEDHWLMDAPIKYETMIQEMIRVGILDNIGTWRLTHKGGAPDRYLRAFYDLLRSNACIPGFKSARQLREVFNTTFNLRLMHDRGFQGKDECDMQRAELKARLSSLFGNVESERNHKTKPG